MKISEYGNIIARNMASYIIALRTLIIAVVVGLAKFWITSVPLWFDPLFSVIFWMINNCYANLTIDKFCGC